MARQRASSPTSEPFAVDRQANAPIYELDDDELLMFDGQQALVDMLERSRQDHLQQLSQRILSQAPRNDPTAEFILSQWNFPPVRNTTTGAVRSIRPDNREGRESPMIQSGVVAEQHRPFAAYGHLDRATLAREFGFDLEQPSVAADQAKPFRINAKSFAITSWTNTAKEAILDEIKQRFGIENVQYICVSEETGELNHQRHVHVQLILKKKVNLKSRFLDEVTGTRCNYQVTRNDLAWNEYIKKDGDYIEFNEFKSTRTRGQKSWPVGRPSIVIPTVLRCVDNCLGRTSQPTNDHSSSTERCPSSTRRTDRCPSIGVGQDQRSSSHGSHAKSTASEILGTQFVVSQHIQLHPSESTGRQ